MMILNPTLTLTFQNREPTSIHKSDIVVTIAIDSDIEKKVLATFGITYGKSIDNQSKYIAQVINHLTSNPSIKLKSLSSDIILKDIVSLTLIKKYIKDKEVFNIPELNIPTTKAIKLLAA